MNAEQWMNRLKAKNQLLSNMKVIYSQPKLTVDLLGTTTTSSNASNTAHDLVIFHETQIEDDITPTTTFENTKKNWKQPSYENIPQLSRGRQLLSQSVSQSESQNFID